MALPKFIGNEYKILKFGDIEDVTVSAGVFGEIVFVSACGFYLMERDGILVNIGMIPFRHRLPVMIAFSLLR